MANDEMTIDELIELGNNPQKMQEHLKSKRNEALNRCVKGEFLSITESLRDQYNERLDGRYVYANTFSSLHVNYPFIDGLNKLLNEMHSEKEKLSPLDVLRAVRAKNAREELNKGIGRICRSERNFTIEISNFFRGFYINCIRNGEPEQWNDIFDVIYEEGFDNYLLVRIKREYLHEYEFILRSIDAEARCHTWFS